VHRQEALLLRLRHTSTEQSFAARGAPATDAVDAFPGPGQRSMRPQLAFRDGRSRLSGATGNKWRSAAEQQHALSLGSRPLASPASPCATPATRHTPPSSLNEI
jgi:hypothetical protein